MPKRHKPQRLSNLLAQSSGNLAHIAQKSLQLSDLNHFLVGTVGDTIAQNCRVSNCTDGILTIETNNSAHSLRLKFLSGEILTNLRKKVLPDLVDILIKVVPNETFYQQSVKKPVKNRQMSEKAGDYILEAASNAPDSLKRKLERLAALRNGVSNDDPNNDPNNDKET